MNEDKSSRYQRRRRSTAIISTAWSAGLLVLLAATPLSGSLRNLAGDLSARADVPGWFTPSAIVLLYVTLLGAIHEAGSLPLAFYGGYLVEHRYGLSNERVGSWLLDELKGLALGFVLSLAGFSALYLVMRAWPDGWWIVAGTGFIAIVALLTQLAPVVLLPLFFTFRALGRDELRLRLLSLSRRAGVAVMDVCEWQIGDRTKKANAALTGLGRTRRILVSDTLLRSHSDDEIEVILAHELGHHVHRDLSRGIALQGVIAFAGFYFAHRALVALSPRLGWDGISDVAGLPVLLLTAGVLAMALLPLTNALSRAMERSADRFAWNLTGRADAFVTGMQRLGSMNLAEERPSWLTRWLFYSHPPIAERIAAARAWDAGHPRPPEPGPDPAPTWPPRRKEQG